jgi:multiple sugar transport system permease protein
MVAPNLLGLLIFYIWPIFQNFYFSFTTWGDFGKSAWSGLDNYKNLFSDPEVLHATQNTFAYAVMTIPVSMAISLVVAAFLNQKIRGIGLYRALYFLPMVTIPAAVAMMWRWLFNGDYGLLNYLLSLVSLGPVRWLSDDTALYAVVLVGIWSSIGFNMIILLAGLQTIPTVYYEAASLDGAGATQRFFRITMPLLSPTVFFLTIVSLINGLQVFDQIFLMIKPKSTAIENTQSLVYLFYKTAFIDGDKGYGAAIVTLLFVIILAITMVQLWFQKKWVHYD